MSCHLKSFDLSTEKWEGSNILRKTNNNILLAIERFVEIYFKESSFGKRDGQTVDLKKYLIYNSKVKLLLFSWISRQVGLSLSDIFYKYNMIGNICLFLKNRNSICTLVTKEEMYLEFNARGRRYLLINLFIFHN